MSKVLGVALMALFHCESIAFGQPLFRIIEAPTPPSGLTVVQWVAIYGISGNGGVVVGCASYSNTQGNSHQTLAFKWTLEGGSVLLSDLPGGAVNSCAHSASMDGTVIVGVGTSYPETTEAVRWTDGVIQGLGDVQDGLPSSSAFDVSENAATIVGAGFGKAFKWQDGVMIGLGNLPGGEVSRATGVSSDGRIVVGTGANNEGKIVAVHWVENEIASLPGFPLALNLSVEVTGVSADGQMIVGNLNSSPQGLRGFRWTTDSLLEFGTQAFAISGDGSTVVGALYADSIIWDDTNGMRILEEVLETELGLFLGSWKPVQAYAVSFDGQTIAGVARRQSDGVSRGFIARLGVAIESDADADGISDSIDLCEATIPTVLVDPVGCPPELPLDLDRDGDADLADLAITQRCWSGPGNPIDSACLNPE